YMHLFTCQNFSGTMREECDEGELLWVSKEEITNLPIWEGDKIFFKLLNTEKRFFSLKLVYCGDELVSHKIEL
ncbi:MAG: DNA mismatch repair protein MutT, partial [Clostridia bacterium]|nr:DNA mismatch repair protein MutT [Clostridia bacterium]